MSWVRHGHCLRREGFQVAENIAEMSRSDCGSREWLCSVRMYSGTEGEETEGFERGEGFKYDPPAHMHVFTNFLQCFGDDGAMHNILCYEVLDVACNFVMQSIASTLILPTSRNITIMLHTSVALTRIQQHRYLYAVKAVPRLAARQQLTLVRGPFQQGPQSNSNKCFHAASMRQRCCGTFPKASLYCPISSYA